MTKEEMTNNSFNLAEDHWDYIEALLIAHGEKVGNIEIARFHYKEAFRHGYKHSYEDQMMEKDNEQL